MYIIYDQHIDAVTERLSWTVLTRQLHNLFV